MPRNETPEALTERLYVLTLAVAEAAERADPHELTALFDQRERVLARLASKELPLSILPRFDDIQAAERDAIHRLCQTRSAAAHEIGEGVKAKSVSRAYRSASAAVSVDAKS